MHNLVDLREVILRQHRNILFIVVIVLFFLYFVATSFGYTWREGNPSVYSTRNLGPTKSLLGENVGGDFLEYPFITLTCLPNGFLRKIGMIS